MQYDVEMVEAAKRGDADAFYALVERYKSAVYSVIWPKVRDFHHAQDLASETFVQAYLSLESLKDPQRVGFWLCGIARNVTGKWLARSKRHVLSVENLIETRPWVEGELQPLRTHPTPPPQAPVEQKETHQLLWRCLYALPEISQEILVLSYIREMKQSEIAELLGISLTAVRNRLSDARKRLKQEMIQMVENTIQNQRLDDNFTDKVIAEAMKRGEAYLAEGRWKEARTHFQRAADVQEDYAPAYRGLGMAAKGMVDDQYDSLAGEVDPKLLDEACDEFRRAYRLGVRDADMVWGLSELYHRFKRCREYVELLWDFAMTSPDTKAAVRAGWRCTWEMQAACAGQDYERALKSHKTLIRHFAGRGTLSDELLSYTMVRRAYRHLGRIDEWYRETALLAEKIGDDMRLEPYYHYMRDRAYELRDEERYPEAIETAQAFVRWAKAYEIPNPRTKWFIIDVQATPLMSIYHQMDAEKELEATLSDAVETLFQYPGEWGNAIESITDESDATRQRLEAAYGEAGFYPEGADVPEIRAWLEKWYGQSNLFAAWNLSDICYQVGKGDAAIDCLSRYAPLVKGRNDRLDTFLNTWLAGLTLRAHNDRETALEYFRQAADVERQKPRVWLIRTFKNSHWFESVQDDPEFLAIVQGLVVGG